MTTFQFDGHYYPRAQRTPEDVTTSKRLKNIASHLLRWSTPDENRPQSSVTAGHLQDIEKYFSQSQYRRMVIIGDKGSGKTVLAIELTVDLAKKVVDDTNGSGSIPVRLNAATWETGKKFSGWLCDQVVLTYGIRRKEAESLAADYALIPVIDGLDEMDIEVADIPGKETPAVRAAGLIAELNSYYAGKSHAPAVIVIRSNCYQRLIRQDVQLSRAHRVAIQPLTTESVIAYLKDRCLDSRSRERTWQPIIAALEGRREKTISVFLSTPWRLTMAVAGVEDDPNAVTELAALPGESTQQAIRRLEHLFLGKFIEAAAKLPTSWKLLRHDSKHVERWLRCLAQHLDWQAEQAHQPEPEPGMSRVHILPHLIWPIGGKIAPRLMHASISLSFWVVTVVGVIAPSVLGVAPRTPANNGLLRSASGDVGAKVSSLLLLEMLLLMAAITAWYAVKPYRVKWPTPWTLDFVDGIRTLWKKFDRIAQQLNSPSFLRRLRTMILIILAPNAIMFLAEIGEQVVSIESGYLITYLVIATVLTSSLKRWDQKESFMLHRPKFRDDIGVTLALICLSIALWAFAYNDLYSGAVIGGAMGAASSAVLAGSWVRYGSGILCAALNGRLPLRFRSFCNWACEVGLLRASGAAYQFRHQELQEWLTRP
ncbi:NACHT domain-containing protein [Nonomuraea wenchangensis]